MGYGLLQQGKYVAARRLLERVRGNLSSPPRGGQYGYLLSMRAHHLINTAKWTDAVASWPLDQSPADSDSRAMDTYALAVGFITRGRLARADSALTVIRALAPGSATDSAYGSGGQVPRVLALQLEARLAWARNESDRAFTLLRQAAASEDALPLEFGPPAIVKPTHELLGELLLAAGRPAEAQREFQRALELAPGRSLALLGLARAARGAGDTAVSDHALLLLAENWREADADLAELAEVRRQRAGRP
jgi:tetratricopeptide (TPR) repeat protein